MKLTKLFSLIILLSSMITFGQKSKQKEIDISMYPKAEKGYVQKVIYLETLAKEDDYNVELFIGKLEAVDKCNNHFLLGNLEEKTIDGWGYNYFQFNSEGQIAGTLMGCSDNKKIDKIVYAQPVKTRYNSKLPIVVYIPKGYSLEYRIWKAGNKLIIVK
ncbi:ecotin family protein [Chishuiella sp.]|uniref:ecotin family protein n=1 Tax=Chishuiella sp. TaxID=1969467 RepID=UPI0028AA1FDE|nr:ecotin family protein [Chishuiella sp.]